MLNILKTLKWLWRFGRVCAELDANVYHQPVDGAVKIKGRKAEDW